MTVCLHGVPCTSPTEASTFPGWLCINAFAAVSNQLGQLLTCIIWIKSAAVKRAVSGRTACGV
jgi:hypothetical protein